MQSAADRELVEELAKIALEQVAPEELAVFEETAEEFFEDQDAVLSPARREEAVGFGLDAALATPYVLAVVIPVVQYLATTVVEATKEQSASVIKSLVRRLFHRGEAPGKAAEPVGLTADQARQVRKVAYDRALALGLPDGQAALLADSVGGGVLLAG